MTLCMPGDWNIAANEDVLSLYKNANGILTSELIDIVVNLKIG